ncbi:MAG: hypothetical protein JO057_03160 [Chloroflexi bacterium]|nr:hypothetical protein [Chloroflexota bacterium]
MAFEGSDVLAIAERVNARLAHGPWDTAALQSSDPNPDADLDTAAEVAVFALELAGKRRQARRGGRFGRLIVNFAFAACVALSTFAAACDKPDATPEETQTAIDELPAYSGSVAAIGQPARASPANFTGMVLMDAGSDSQPWAVLQASDSSNPILVDRVGSGLDTVGDTYSLAAQPIMVGTRDGASQFLDPLQPAVNSGGTPASVANTAEQLEQRWSQDERYLAPTRAISGQTTVLDAAYNAAAAAAAGGTHTYLNGVVLRVEPDKPVLSVIDKALLESGAPTREEDVVYVAIPPSAQSSYNPGQVVNLRNVVMNQQQTDVNGQSTTLYTVDAAVNGAQVEPTGTVDLQSLLQPRLQRVDQDIAANDQAAGTGTPGAPATPGLTPTPGPGPTQPPQQVIVRDRGPSFVDDFLIWMWISNSGYYRGPSVIINNPPTSISRPSDSTYYSPPPVPSSSSPSTVAASQAASRSTALEASRSAVSGQASGTGGGVAATNKSAAASSVAVGAATAKAASVAGDVSTSSAGKSAASVAGGSAGSSIASRSAGTTSAGTRGSAGVSSSSGGSSSGGLSSSSSSGRSSSGGFGSSSGGKGISGASSS